MTLDRQRELVEILDRLAMAAIPDFGAISTLAQILKEVVEELRPALRAVALSGNSAKGT